MKTDFANGDRLFAEDLNDNFQETDSRLNAAGTDANALVSGTVNNARLPVLEHSKMPSGSVIQVVSQNFATPKTITSNSFVDTDIELAITPRFNTSKIYVVFQIDYRMYRHDDDGEVRFNLYRDATLLRQDVVGFEADGVTEVNDYRLLTVHHYDSPATTDEILYKMQFAHANSTEPRSVTVNNYSTSNVVLFEVAG